MEKAALEWRREFQRARLNAILASAYRRLTDFGMVMEFVSGVAETLAEEKVVESSFGLFGGRPPRGELGDDRLNDKVRFWVTDNGPGLTAEQQSRFFTTFTRLHQVRATGQGLGLSIARRIMEKLGGEAWVESESGKGSRFGFTLPGTQPSAGVPSDSGCEAAADERSMPGVAAAGFVHSVRYNVVCHS